MRKNIVLIVFMTIFSMSFSEIKVKIVEPLRFRDINHTEVGPNQVVAVSHVEIYTTDKEKDLGKRITFKFPNFVNMTNRKKWVKVERVGMDRKQNEIILENERELVKFYAILDRRELDKGESIEVIEGEYVGQLPIVMGVYSLVNANTKPVEPIPNPEGENRPQILPIFPDEIPNENKGGEL
ncbi:hypothetical protein MKD34_01530 [Cetobacterium somerae]|uniref:hypothetical protein n=1 Tax=Cetobacterium somerae TaxID=188913 RepID=UPI001F0640FD|nr:hypothetical protein [Cetobacterium somerae]UPO97552.1 hypothetical protein MKD34_01530 [Cetobacterium somerae]